MKTKWVVQLTVITVIFSTLNFRHSIGFAQGALTPPGAPAPVMKSLDQIEPRTPISGQLFITNSGSYYFTTNVTATGGYGIFVQADNVSIDLSGFTLSAGNNGSSDGILVNGHFTNLTVYNGTIRNWGAVGLDASQSTVNRFELLKIFNNKGAGLLAGDSTQVKNTSASANNGDGINIGGDSMVMECSAVGNNGVGIVVRDNGSINSSMANSNTNGGIVAGQNCLLSHCLVVSNAANGIVVSNNSSIAESLVNYNSHTGIVAALSCTIHGCTVFDNLNGGITVATDCLVSDNNCSYNGHFAGAGGIRVFGSGNRIDGNNVCSNEPYGMYLTFGSVGNLMIRNHVYGSDESWISAPSNSVGVNVNMLGGVESDSVITNSNPWANFSF